MPSGEFCADAFSLAQASKEMAIWGGCRKSPLAQIARRDWGNAPSLWPSLRDQRLAMEPPQCGSSGIIDAAQILRMMR